MMIARGGWNPAAMVRQLAVGLRLVSRERATVATTTDGSLAVLGTALTAACAAVETNFLHIGSELQDVYRHTMELRNLVTAAVGHIGGTEDGGVPARLCAVAEDATAELAAIEREVKEKSGCMDTIGATFKKLDRAAAETHKVARILGIIGMNIGVEGARSREAHELFSVVADNTRSLAAKLAGLADANHEVITRALRHQQEVAEHVTAGLTDIHRLGDHARETMAAAVRESETLVGTLMQVAGKAGGCAGDITRKVGELVMGVQLHDRMSQRVAHIVEILADRKDDHISPLLLQLQAAQLEEVIAEIRTCHRQATESLGAIGAAVRTLLGDLERLSRAGTAEFSPPVPGDDDPFAGLKTSLILLNDTLERGERLVVPLRKAILQAAQNIRQVSGRVSEVRTIGQETHLMALNAIVKSAHLQENGGPLEVLAQEVKRSSDVSTATVSRIDDLVAVVENLARKLDDSETAAAVARHRGMHDTGLEELTAAYDRFTTGFAAAFNLAQSLLKTTVELHTEVDFLPALADRFTGLLEQLQENVSHCADTPAGISVPDEETHARLTRRYTMEQEREVHHRLLTLIPGGNPGPGSTPVGTGTIRLVTPGAVVADKDDNADDIDGFELFGAADGNDTGAEDIELFDSGPAGIPTPTAATKEVGSIELFDENIELFDDEPAPAAAKPSHEDPEKTPAAATNSKTGPNAGEPDDDFGDNVELF